MHQHWVVILQGLPNSGRAWDESVAMHLLEDASLGTVDALSGLRGDVHWHVSILPHDELFHLHGQWQSVLERKCSRCNASFDWHLSGQTERDFQLGRAEGESGNNSECEYLVLPGRMNMLDVLREDIWLAWKADVICSDSCKGLCLGCGCNLNVSACQCKKNGSDHPFAALRKMKLNA